MKKSKLLSIAALLAATMCVSLVGTACSDEGKVDVPEIKDLKMMTIASGGTDEALNGPLAKEIDARSGYNITYSQFATAADDAQSQLTTIFTTKSDYDCVKVSKNQLFALMSQGALADLTDYVKDTTYLKEQVSETGWGLATQNGKIYAIPQRNSIMSNNVILAFRQDWLAEYNAANESSKIEVPSKENGYAMTLSDYKKMTEYFATKAETGMVIDKGGVFQESILPAFGIYGEFTDVDGKLYYYTEHPNFTKYVDYVKSITHRYNKDGAGATNGMASFKAGKCGAFRVAYWSGASLKDMIDANQVGFIQALVDDRASVNGHIDATKVRANAVDGYSYFTIVPKYKGEAVAKAVVKYADAILEPELFKFATIGEEGKTYTVKDGDYYPILDGDAASNFNKMNIADKYLVATRETDYAIYWWARARKNEYNYMLTLVAFNNMNNIGIRSIAGVMPPIDAYNKYQSKAIGDSSEKLILAMFDNGVTVADVNKAYNDANGAKVAEEVNAWYKTWADKDTYNPVKAPVFA